MQDTFQTGRSGPGSHTSTHLVQDVLVIHTDKASLDFSASGLHPVRFFAPSTDSNDVATAGTYVYYLPKLLVYHLPKLLPFAR